MPRTIPANSLSGMMAAESSQAWLVLLTITHSTGTVRFTSDAVNTSFGGNTYYALPFDIILPSNETGKIPEATLVLDNVDRQLIAELRTQSTPMTVQIDVVASGDVAGGNATATYTDFVLRSIDYTSTSISGRLTLEDFLAEPFPKDIFSQSLFPGLFTFGTNTDYEPPVMGEDATDFSEYTVLGVPGDWTKESGGGATASVVGADPYYWANPTGGQMFQVTNTSASQNSMFTWDEVGVGQDVEVYAKLYMDPSYHRAGIMLRFDGTTADSGYFFGANTDGTVVLGRQNITASSITAIGATVPSIVYSRRDPYFLRFRVVGSLLQAKIWVGQESEEPTAWTYEETDTTYTAAGKIGLFGRTELGDYFWCDYFIVKNPVAYSYPSDIGAPTAAPSAVYDDFSGYTVGVQPYLWLEKPVTPYGDVSISTDSDPQGAGLLKVDSDLNETIGAIRVDGTKFRDQEVLVYMYTQLSASDTRGNGAMVRHNDVDGDLAFYAATVDYLGNGRLWASSGTQLGSTIPLGLAAGWTYCRLRVTGGFLQAKWWSGSLGAEPGYWMIGEYDYTYSVGHPGVVTSQSNITYYSKVAFAYNGATASFS